MKRYANNGYWELVLKDGTRILEHRFVVEKSLGRKLLSEELVHHINHNRKDNRIENLEVMSASAHARLHVKRAEYGTYTCEFCARSFVRRLKRREYDKRRTEHLCCSKSCAAKLQAKRKDLDVSGSHGTLSGYLKCGPPRCSLCKEKMRLWKRDRRAAKQL